MKKVLVILFDNTEEIEALAPADILRRAGADVLTAAAGNSRRIVGRSGIPIEADSLLADVAAERFDAAVLPGGPGVFAALSDARLAGLLKRLDGEGALMCAICAAPAALGRAGIIGGRRCASHPSVAGVLPSRDAAASTVRDGKLITSQGAGTAVEFALEIASALFGGEKAAEVASSICFKFPSGQC